MPATLPPFPVRADKVLGLLENGPCCDNFGSFSERHVPAIMMTLRKPKMILQAALPSFPITVRVCTTSPDRFMSCSKVPSSTRKCMRVYWAFGAFQFAFEVLEDPHFVVLLRNGIELAACVAPLTGVHIPRRRALSSFRKSISVCHVDCLFFDSHSTRDR